MNRTSKYTEEQKMWLIENAYGVSNIEIAKKFNELFEKNITATQVDTFKNYYGLTGGCRYKYTDEQKEWIKNNYIGISTEELTKRFNEKFDTTLKPSQLKGFKDYNKLRSGTWTIMNQEQDEWIRNNVVGLTNKELTDKFNETFGTNLTVQQIGIYKTRRYLKSGLTPQNGYAHNERPIGSEHKKSLGYIYIKVGKNEWIPKQRYMYEKYHGSIPDDHTIIFANGNKNDFSEDNLIAIKQPVQQIASLQGLFSDDKELTKTGLLIAEVINKVSELNKEGDSNG